MLHSLNSFKEVKDLEKLMGHAELVGLPINSSFFLGHFEQGTLLEAVDQLATIDDPSEEVKKQEVFSCALKKSLCPRFVHPS